MKIFNTLLLVGLVSSSSLVTAIEPVSDIYTGLDVFSKQQILLNIKTQIELLEAHKKLKELTLESSQVISVGDQPKALPSSPNDNVQWLNPTAPIEKDKLETAYVDSAYIPLGKTNFVAVVNIGNSNIEVVKGDELYGWKITSIKAGRIDLKHTKTNEKRSLGDGSVTVQ